LHTPDAFSSATPDNDVLFELVVTKAWLRQVIVALVLMCRGSLRGVVEFLRDLLGVSISVGSVHDILQSAAEKAAAVNREQDLSAIREGLHDELFQGTMPVLAGVCARSTYCSTRCGFPGPASQVERERSVEDAESQRRCGDSVTL
jgi:hypothetical protein